MKRRNTFKISKHFSVQKMVDNLESLGVYIDISLENGADRHFLTYSVYFIVHFYIGNPRVIF